MILHISYYNCIINDKDVFPKSKRSFLSIFPKYSCQSGSFCRICFIGQIIAALNFEDNQEYQFNYLNAWQTIECINNFIKVDINPIIYLIEENIKSNSINISSDGRCFLSHKIAFASYLNIFNSINNFNINGTFLNYFIDDIKIKFYEIRNFIYNSKINKEYYE